MRKKTVPAILVSLTIFTVLTLPGFSVFASEGSDQPRTSAYSARDAARDARAAKQRALAACGSDTQCRNRVERIFPDFK